MKSIETLVDDIYEVLDKGIDIDDEQAKKFGHGLARIIRTRLSPRSDDGNRRTLRMSNIGTPCNRKLYYSINDPEGGEPLTPQTRLKFLYGDILEELLLFLADAAGHSVEGRQDELEIEGVLGHRDAVIDGVTVDTKSASTYSFKKFAEHRLHEDDAFGYIDQMQSYIEAGQDDPIVTDKDRGAFLVIDKTLGHICLDIHKKSSFPIRKMYEYKKNIVSSDTLPPRGFKPIPDGKSGNEKLDTFCSYCEFKRKCHPELRTFLYANKPIHLTKVVREPKVPELTSTELEIE